MKAIVFWEYWERQFVKLGMILENKVFQKLKLEKMFFLQKMVS